MRQEFKTLKTIAVHALYGLLNFEGADEYGLEIRVSQDPDIGHNIFAFTFGEPEEKDSGTSEEPYLALLVEVNEVREGLFDCKVIHWDMVCDPKENTLSYETNLENFKRARHNSKSPHEPPNE